jgi:hypothetical protein
MRNSVLHRTSILTLLVCAAVASAQAADAPADSSKTKTAAAAKHTKALPAKPTMTAGVAAPASATPVAPAASAPASPEPTTPAAPATSAPAASAPAVDSDELPATTSANGKVVLRENLYYYDAFNHRDPFRSLVDGAYNRSDKMDLVNLNSVQLVGIVRGEVDRFALLEDASGYSYILRVGDRVHNGTVVSIGEDELVARVTNFGQTTTVRLHLVGR